MNLPYRHVYFSVLSNQYNRDVIRKELGLHISGYQHRHTRVVIGIAQKVATGDYGVQAFSRMHESGKTSCIRNADHLVAVLGLLKATGDLDIVQTLGGSYYEDYRIPK